jgi:uncharacterized membrane protein
VIAQIVALLALVLWPLGWGIASMMFQKPALRRLSQYLALLPIVAFVVASLAGWFGRMSVTDMTILAVVTAVPLLFLVAGMFLGRSIATLRKSSRDSLKETFE